MEVRLKASLKQMIGKSAMKKYALDITSTLYQDDKSPISTVCDSGRILEFVCRICHFYRLHICMSQSCIYAYSPIVLLSGEDDGRIVTLISVKEESLFRLPYRI